MIFHYFSQNDIILKMDSRTSKRNKRNTLSLYDCRDIGGSLGPSYTIPDSSHTGLLFASDGGGSVTRRQGNPVSLHSVFAE